MADHIFIGDPIPHRGTTMKIDSFKGDHAFLSNFYRSSIVMHDGMEYPTVEHAFQAHKTHDMQERHHISQLDTPGKAKRAGRKVKLRDDWEEIKVAIMRGIVERKFLDHRDLREKLLATGNAELIEGNTWNDIFWGMCRGKGENHLGKILMEVREYFRKAGF